MLRGLLTIDVESWLEDIDSIGEFYNKIGDTLPEGLKEELSILNQNLTDACEGSIA